MKPPKNHRNGKKSQMRRRKKKGNSHNANDDGKLKISNHQDRGSHGGDISTTSSTATIHQLNGDEGMESVATDSTALAADGGKHHHHHSNRHHLQKNTILKEVTFQEISQSVDEYNSATTDDEEEEEEEERDNEASSSGAVSTSQETTTTTRLLREDIEQDTLSKTSQKRRQRQMYSLQQEYTITEGESLSGSYGADLEVLGPGEDDDNTGVMQSDSHLAHNQRNWQHTRAYDTASIPLRRRINSNTTITNASTSGNHNNSTRSILKNPLHQQHSSYTSSSSNKTTPTDPNTSTTTPSHAKDIHLDTNLHHHSSSTTTRKRNRSHSPLPRSKSMSHLQSNRTSFLSTNQELLLEQKQQDVTFLQYVLQELNWDLFSGDSDNKRNEGWNEEALEALYRSPSSISSGVYNFLRVPFGLERFITYAMMVCVDTFLYYVTLLPLRLLCAGKKLLLRQPFKIQEICDVLRILTMMLTLFFLMPLFNYSFLYHYIRGQSTLKLYVTYNMLELFDKMSSAFGIDIQDAMYYSATKLYFDREIQQVSERILVWRDCVLSILGYTVYLFVHTTLLYVRIITLNVALNSSNNALFTLLVSNNFLELKKPIFKRFAKENVFQFSCHDATERFQLIIFGLIISMQNSRAAVFTGGEIWDVAYCLMAEVIVDFLKHAFIAKFNDISSSVYGKFLDKICEDMTDDRLQDTFLDNMNIASRRLGFTPIPLVTIVLYVSYLYFEPQWSEDWWTWIFYAQLFFTLLLLKFLMNIVVVGYASRRRFKMEQAKKLKKKLKRLKEGMEDTVNTGDVSTDEGAALSTRGSLTESDESEDKAHHPDAQEDLNLNKIFRFALFGKRLPE